MSKGNGTIIKVQGGPANASSLIFPSSYMSPFCCPDTDPFVVSAHAILISFLCSLLHVVCSAQNTLPAQVRTLLLPTQPAKLSSSEPLSGALLVWAEDPSCVQAPSPWVFLSLGTDNALFLQSNPHQTKDISRICISAICIPRIQRQHQK